MIQIRNLIPKKEIDIIFHGEAPISRILSDDGDMIFIEIGFGIDQVEEQYLEYQEQDYYGYFHGKMSEYLGYLQEYGIIAFYRTSKNPIEIVNDEVILYLKGKYLKEYDGAIASIKKECGPFEISYNKEKVQLFEKIYNYYGNWICRYGIIEFLLKNVNKLESSGKDIASFIDWMKLEEKYRFYTWDLLLYAIASSNNENVAKMFAYFSRFMSEAEKEDFHFELLGEENVVYDNTYTKFTGKFQNYYYKEEDKNKEKESVEIDNFIKKIVQLKELAKEGVLETRKEQDLLTEIRNFPYESTVDNEIILLKIKKMKAHPQTIWSTPRNGGFSGAVNQYILDWESLFREYIGKSETLSPKSENESIYLESSSVESTNEIKVNFDFNNNNVVKITPYISYNQGNQEFYNPRNGIQYKLSDDYSRHIIDLLILKNEHKVVNFINDNQIILTEYTKGKKGGKKWGSFHEFLQSKIKNIGEKIEAHLEIEKAFRTSFLSCTKEFIAIKIMRK